MSKDAQEFRRKHGRLVKGWRKILEKERRLGVPLNSVMQDFNLTSAPTLDEALALKHVGCKLSKMGENGIKDKRLKFTGKAKSVEAKFVSGGLPSLGKER